MYEYEYVSSEMLHAETLIWGGGGNMAMCGKWQYVAYQINY